MLFFKAWEGFSHILFERAVISCPIFEAEK